MPTELSKKSIDIIKESASLITLNDTKITSRTYEILFGRFPKLKALFVNAPKDQYMKLADALSAYAVNIDRLQVLKPALDVIARTHVNSKVKPVHYPMVGIALIQAIEDILGDQATPEFIDAWREAYQHIADVLIEMEETIYSQQT